MCGTAQLLRIVNMSTTTWRSICQPTAPASTYEGRTPSRQPPELETPPLVARAERLQKHDNKQGHERRRPHGPAAARSHRGALPRALTPIHGPAAARTHPRTHRRRGIGWLGRRSLSDVPLVHGPGNGSRRGVVKRVVLMLTNDSA
jgi:hypothetical protein